MANNKPALKKELGLLELTVSGVGNILGAGIYVLIGKAAGLAGNALWMSFLFAGIAISFTGLSYMELSSMFPKAGAEYVYVKQAFGDKMAFLVGWFVLVGETIAISTVALGFGGYFGTLFGTAVLPVAIILILVFTLILFTGVKLSVRFAIIMTATGVMGLLVVIVIGLPYMGSINYLDVTSLSGLFEASALVFFAFLGFEEIVRLSQETKNPEKTTTKALVLAIVVTVSLYILIALTAVSVYNWQELAKSSAPLADVASVAFGKNAFELIIVIALFSTANAVLFMLLGSSRILYGMAEHGAIPNIIAWVHPSRRTPWIAISTIALVSISLTFIGDIATVANISNFMVFLIFITVNITLIRLRFCDSFKYRPFRVPLNIGNFPIIPLLGTVSTMILFLHLNLTVIIYGFLFVGIGVLIIGIKSRNQTTLIR
ncbi:amino acid permease-associated region [Methanohalobium evestigatum Z-7303]|uniref:Amino acid permease-associated region n=1 Tax=Methanohalobium evestigatum (strain ATCC BAA-1072 / DSM 3721 / NBRC 107634 / OCM 161 / Z-7303) TaxID=644295 RepID=D7E7F4_METEZ|nr:APC family permease [Methanohalobium evestigatum]ADI73903.1 amino acid permease-associated region [Methanohalobium evestigatum Z-7303]